MSHDWTRIASHVPLYHVSAKKRFVLGATVFSPSDISSGIAWYRADTGITLNGSDVSDWEDKFGNGNDATMATASNQPFYNSSNVTFNNEPTVDFDGTELLEKVVFAGGDLTQPTTIFAVGIYNAANGKIMDGTTNSERHIMERSSGDKWRHYAGTILDSADTADSSAHIWTARFNTTSSDFYLDGGTAYKTGSVGTHVLGGVSIGGDQSGSGTLEGDIAELIIYNKLLSTSEMNNLGQYADTRYGITYSDIS